MKKRTAPKKSTAKKTVKRTVPHSSSRISSPSQSFIFRRIVIVTACLVLLVGVTATVDRPVARQAVQGVSIMAGLYDQATVQLPTIPEAKGFNIYYGTAGQEPFTNAARDIQPNVGSYTISDLKRGVTYEYYYVYVDSQGKEVTPQQELSNGHLVVQTLSNVQPE
jgi:hypothetical protein